MEISWRGLVTVGHGMFFGGFFLLALFGALVVFWRTVFERVAAVLTPRGHTVREALSLEDDCAGMGGGADGDLCGVSMVSGGSAEGDCGYRALSEAGSAGEFGDGGMA